MQQEWMVLVSSFFNLIYANYNSLTDSTLTLHTTFIRFKSQYGENGC